MAELDQPLPQETARPALADEPALVASPAPLEARTAGPKRTPGWKLALGYLLIASVTLAVYWPSLRGGFIWDDDFYVTENKQLQTLTGLREIWLNPRATPQYYPLVYTTFWVEHHFWGLKPFGYHVVNALLHAASAVVLWQVLRRLQVPGAWAAAAIFAVHPVHVETVAWVTERKNVLSLFCYMLTALAYVRFTKLGSGGSEGRRSWGWYPLVLLLMACALLSKTVTCTLVAALLLVTWWKRGRVTRGDLLALAPLFIMGLGMGLITVWLEKHHVGAEGREWTLSLLEKTLLAGRIVCFYAAKLVWPAKLTFVYPRWQIDAHQWWQYLYPAGVLVSVVLLWLARRRIGRGPLVAVLFFVATLGPALGFVSVYPMVFSYVADHFQYHASIGLIVLAAAVVRGTRGDAKNRVLRSVLLLDVILVLGALSWRQAHVYKDAETLWRVTLDRNPEAALAHHNLAALLAKQPGKLGEAERHLRRAVEITPGDPLYNKNMGLLLLRLRQPDQALSYFQKAVEIQPDFDRAYIGVATCYMHLGFLDKAVDAYRKLLEVHPEHGEGRYGLVKTLEEAGRNEEAILEYSKLLEKDPQNPLFLHNTGQLLLKRGDFESAAAYLAEAAQIRPDSNTYLALGEALAGQGHLRDAVAAYREALRLQEKWPTALNKLAWLLATAKDESVRDGREAVRLAKQACEAVDYSHPLALRTFAEALASVGQMADAVTVAKQALEIAQPPGDDALIAELQESLKRYEAAAATMPATSTAPTTQGG